MAKTVRVFDFELTGVGALLPNPPDIQMPTIYICLKSWSGLEGGTAPVISADLHSESEIDACIAELKAGLDVVAKSAKTAFRKAESKSNLPSLKPGH